MFIKEKLSQHRFDFTAILGCEHCEHEAHLKHGYDDGNYHQNVIPAMLCGGCGKNRGGKADAESSIVNVETH